MQAQGPATPGLLPEQHGAAQQGSQAPTAGLALLLGVLRRDADALQWAIPGAVPTFSGLTALHAAALSDWGLAVPLLVSLGVPVDGQLPDPAAVAASLAPLGLPLETLARVPPGATPLQLAVSAGSVSAATGLVAAGARLDGAFQLLPGVAERLCSAGAGGPAVGAVAMQRLIEALMRRGMPPPFGPAEAAHQAAAELAYPEAGAPYPPLPWLIIELLSHHIHGRLAPGTHPAAYAPAMDAMLRGLYEAADGPAGSTPVRRAALEAVVMRWLGLLPAAHLGPRLWAHGEALVEAGMLGALRQLLAFPSVRQGLQASVAALPGEPAPAAAGPTRLLLAAAVSGRPEALDAVLAAGGGVSLQAVVGVLQDGSLASSERARALDLLLSRGAPHVPEGGVAGLDCCPVYAQLGCQRARQEEALAESAFQEPDARDEPLQRAHLEQLRLMERLRQAGYRPVAFSSLRGTSSHGRERVTLVYPPADPVLAALWELDSGSKWLWRAATQEAWCPASHARSFPAAFKDAAHMLLMAAHRGRPEAQQAAAMPAAADAAAGPSIQQLGALPRAVLHRILAAAAYPLSAWRPAMEGGWALQQLAVQRAAAAQEEEGALQEEEEEEEEDGWMDGLAGLGAEEDGDEDDSIFDILA